MAALVQESREINDHLRVITVLNAADAQGKDNEESGDAMRDFADFEYCPTALIRRKAFPNAAAAGLSVLEHYPRDPKAVDEFARMMEYVCAQRTDIDSISHRRRSGPESVVVR